MAGHSQFKNIMFKKGAKDAKRAKVFTKLAREMTVAAKMGGPDPAMNPRLRLAIQNARAENMPKDNIERAIKKAAGSDAEDYTAMRYEGFGPGGVGLIVETLTDNLNRTASDVRSTFSKHGGNLGQTGAVSFMFQRLGQILYKGDAAGAEAMLEAAIEAGADDCQSAEDSHEIVCATDTLAQVRDALVARFGEPESTLMIWRPATLTPVDEETAGTVFKLIEALEDNDDVQYVYSNADVSAETLAKLSA